MKKISILLVLVILSTCILSGCGPEYIEGTKLRCDGVYKSKLKDADGQCSYVCFYEEGSAATLDDASIKTPKEAYEEFHNGSIKARHSTSFQTSSGVIVNKKMNGKKSVEKAPDAKFTIKVNTGITTYEVYAYSKHGIRCNIDAPIFDTNDKYYEFVSVD